MISRTTRLVEACAIAVLILACGTGGSASADEFSDIRLPGKNLVNNGGFERGTDAWEYFAGRRHSTVVTDEAHTGANCLKVTGVAGDYRYLNQTPVLLVPGREYTLSAWMKCEGFTRAGENSQVVNLHNYGWTKGVNVTPGKPDEDWTFHSVTFAAPTTSEVAGRPSYTLCIFWPIGSEGTVWIDDIQIEEGPAASEFTESYVGWGIDTLETLRRVRKQGDAVRASLAKGLNGVEAPAGLTARADEALAAVSDLVARLGKFAELPLDQARALPDEGLALAGGVARLSGIAFISDPYRPLREITLPERELDELTVSLTCLQGASRAVALSIANLGPDTSVARVVPGDLYDTEREVRLVGTEWVTAHFAPQLRGHLKPWERFTDPLPRLDPGGTWTLAAGQINQIVLVADTSNLLPGEYRGEVEVSSLTEQAPARTLVFELDVAPVRLATVEDKLVCDVGMMAGYALDSIGPLGVNTFTVSAQWLAPECGENADEITADFARVAPVVKARLQRCPDARFWIGFGGGDMAARQLEKLRGPAPSDAEFAARLGSWAHAVVRGFGELGVTPDRLIIETVDEPGAGQREQSAAVAEAIKAAEPQLRTHTYVTSFDQDDEGCRRMYAAHDIIGLAYTSVSEESVAYLRGIGKQIWVYDCQNSAETFHPVTYYRLLPWLAWRHGLDGWGHFSMLDSERGRGYEPWHGVAEESLVYPSTAGGQVISRRWLALEAGTQDYRALVTLSALAKAAKDAGVSAEAVARADELITRASQEAANLPKPGREYFTGLNDGADPAVLDRFREEAAGIAGELAEALAGDAKPLAASIESRDGTTHLRLTVPRSGELTARYLCDYQLPWRVVSAPVAQGENRVPLPGPAGARVSRCVFQVANEQGLITAGFAQPLARITVDSTIDSYSPERLNDGLAMPGMKFEPEWGWISGGGATEHWVAAALDEPVAVKGVRVWWMTFYGPPLAYRVQARVDGDWQDVPGFADWQAARSAVEEITFPPVTADAVRVVQKAGGGNANFVNLMGMSEIELVTE